MPFLAGWSQKACVRGGRTVGGGLELGSFKDLKGDLKGSLNDSFWSLNVCREGEREWRQMKLGGPGGAQGLQGHWGSLFVLVSVDWGPLEAFKQQSDKFQLPSFKNDPCGWCGGRIKGNKSGNRARGDEGGAKVLAVDRFWIDVTDRPQYWMKNSWPGWERQNDYMFLDQTTTWMVVMPALGRHRLMGSLVRLG